ncbi:MAG: phosphoesterase [Pirellulaceae bacterium]|nr:MAG: phosphoesterase [Pirellulaceae bacterium]
MSAACTWVRAFGERVVLGGVFALLVGWPLFAEPPKADPAEVYRPSLVPDRILLSIPGDPSRTMAVTWRTSTVIEQAWAEITRATAEPLSGSTPRRIPARTERLETDLFEAHYHTVIFEDLAPQTRYAYRVGDGVNWSPWHHFQTASDKPEPFRFLYFGDAQNDIASHWSRVIREAFQTEPRAAFLLHAGDLINRWNRDAEWGEWHAAGGWINGCIPSIAAAGNHEYGGVPPLSSVLTPNWRAQFEFPRNGPEGLHETVYYFDYQAARIVVLNSNLAFQEQATWLESVLRDHDRPWTIVSMHHPIYSARPGRDNPVIRSLWKPLFDRYRVALVLQGHDHSYMRSGLLGESAPDEPIQRQMSGGTVYVISVSGPKMYDLGWQPFTRRAARNTQMYQVIEVAVDKLRFEARMADGRLYDAFHLTRNADGSVQLHDEIPSVPDRR